MSRVRRVFVEKKPAYAGAGADLAAEIRSYLGIGSVKRVRILIRYDVENISDEVFETALRCVFSEPPVDEFYLEDYPRGENERSFAVEYLPGQFDQRADSAMQCVRFLKEDEECVIRSATVYVVDGAIDDEQFGQIKSYCINPVDSREAADEKPDTLLTEFEQPADIAVLTGFTSMPVEDLNNLYSSLNLAMT